MTGGTPITTGNFAKALKPGIMGWIELAYKRRPSVCDQVFDKASAKFKYEESVSGVSFPLAQTKEEGAATTFATETQGYTVRTDMVAKSLGFAVTKEEVRDNLYAEVSKRRSARLGESFRETKEIIGHGIFNNAFAVTRTGGDGVAMISNAHPVGVGGTQSNLISTGNADLSDASLKTVLIDIMKQKDTRGFRTNHMPKTLFVPAEELYNAQTIINSSLRSGTANNDTNAIKDLNSLQLLASPYLTDDDAFFVINDFATNEGLVHFMRDEFELKDDYDTVTCNTFFVGYERYAFNYLDWRVVHGSQGA
jgi:hypothetical protein